jgi:type VI secretion system protein ImpA
VNREVSIDSPVNIVSETAQASDKTNTISINNNEITNRNEAILQLRKVRKWFLASEPGSPIINLLFFTEQLIGKDFLALMKIIPAELIQKLELEGEKE